MSLSGQLTTATERPPTSISTSTTSRSDRPMGSRVVPVPIPVRDPNTVMSAPIAATDPMDVTTPTNNTSPTGGQGSDTDLDGKMTDQSKNSSPQEPHPAGHSMYMSAPPPAAPAVHQPKIVQTAFIHKLYNMLEDPNIGHLISWSSTADSFVMSPSPDFSKVLSQYFKHTNVSSFVRQLNMYGFHKERDVFHTGNPESTLWEFKHGAGCFKRGDINGLREIKRRASRHALVNRDNNYPKPVPSQPGTPADPMHMNPESSDSRLANLEYTIHDLNSRLQRSEETAQYMHAKSQALMETTNRILFFNQELSRTMLTLIPTESPAHRDVMTLQGEMQRQVDALRVVDDPEPPTFSSRQHYFGNLENPSLSPRQHALDDSRRTTLAVPQQTRGQNFYRPTVPSNLSIGARRPYGSIGGGTTVQASPSRNPPAPPPGPHPLSNVEPHPSSLARRHTSADIREHGWPAGMSPTSANTPSAYPSTPNKAPPEGQQLRESLSSYNLQTAYNPHSTSRPTTPPSYANGGGMNGGDAFNNWSWGSAASRGLGFKDSSAPPTRRGSMAHILNPSDTIERSDEDEDPRGDDDRKRRRK